MPRPVVDWLLFLFGLNCVLAMLLLGLYFGPCYSAEAGAQEPPPGRPYVFFAPAAGPVDHYLVRVRTEEIELWYLSESAEPLVKLPGLPPGSVLDVIALAANRPGGPWSCRAPAMPDLNGDGIIDAADLVELARCWGASCCDAGMFEAMRGHWGHRTEESAGSGLRRCVD